MGQRPPRLAYILTAVLFALSCFCFTLFVWKSFGGTIPLEPKGYRFRAFFGPEASQLATNAEVRISGVRVGRVVLVSRTPVRTEAVIELESKFGPLPSDARAIMRYKTLLGESFIELSPGSRTAPKVPENGALKLSQIAPVQQLDEVLGAFDAETRDALKRFLRDISSALEDRGPDLNAALGNLAPATSDLAHVAELLSRQDASVRALVRDSGAALESIGRREDRVQELVTAGEQVLGATAARNRAVTETVRALPPFLRDLRGALASAEGVAGDAAPTLRALRPVAPLLRPALDETSRLAPELQRVFRALDPAIDSGRRGLPALQRIVEAARPLMGVLHPAGRELVPVVELVGAYRRELVTAQAGLGAATQASTTGPDGQPLHYLRVMAPINNEADMRAERRYPTNRFNPYFAPGGLANIGSGGLMAFDCRNTGNPAGIPPIAGGPPPCREQQPWTFRGATRSYPRLEPTGP